ncbi:hypothetical protein [Burkholderia plantarii]|uniref:hypothetical protein n=1 Tax=Burkholderia plantarii TaxID=41899 RepID=UPI00087096FB|nr:hypothetical protein [Burkholderia plantarii]
MLALYLEYVVDLPSIHHTGPRFKLGRIFTTPAALAACATAQVSMFDLLLRHVRGDWGDLSEPDRLQNEQALEAGLALLSSYALPDRATIWVITEWDRSITTLLTPSDY